MSDLVTFVLGTLIGAFTSWLISHRYYIKANADQRAELSQLSEKLRARNTLRDFEQLVETANWTKTFVDHREIWICNEDNTFQIERGERTREFKERWTTVYPDRSGSADAVYLKIGGTTIKELTFISMDGGRIFVPMAEVRADEMDRVEYFWNRNSLAVKVCRIIGTYYIHNDLDGVARISKVTIIE